MQIAFSSSKSNIESVVWMFGFPLTFHRFLNVPIVWCPDCFFQFCRLQGPWLLREPALIPQRCTVLFFFFSMPDCREKQKVNSMGDLDLSAHNCNHAATYKIYIFSFGIFASIFLLNARLALSNMVSHLNNNNIGAKPLDQDSVLDWITHRGHNMLSSCVC